MLTAAIYFSKLAQYRARSYDIPGYSPKYATLPKWLNDIEGSTGIHRIFRQVSQMQQPRALLVRKGDTDQAYQPVDQRHQAHVEATILANVLVALKFTTRGLHSEEKRFVPVEGEEGMTSPYRYGYHADHWLGMVVAFYSFWNRRTRSHHARIDGQASATPIKAVGRIEADNMTGIIISEQGGSTRSTPAPQGSDHSLVAPSGSGPVPRNPRTAKPPYVKELSDDLPSDIESLVDPQEPDAAQIRDDSLFVAQTAEAQGDSQAAVSASMSQVRPNEAGPTVPPLQTKKKDRIKDATMLLMDEMRAEMRAEMRDEMRAEMSKMRSEIRNEIRNEIRSELNKEARRKNKRLQRFKQIFCQSLEELVGETAESPDVSSNDDAN